MTTAALNKRTPRRPSTRALEIFRRHQILGESQREVARAMGCSAPRVHQICRYVSRWLAEQPAEPNVPAIRQRHEQVFRWLLSEAVREWERSKQTIRTTKARTVRGRRGKDGEPLPDLVTSEYVDRPQCGDPRYLTAIDQLLKSERAMWGADEPKRHEHSGADGGPITLANVLAIIQDNPPSPPAFIDPNPPNVIDVESCAALIADPNFQPETIDGELRPVPDFQNLEVEPAEVLPDESPETGDGESADDGPGDERPEFVFRLPGS